jgi:FKBP-type peptidyl-prolyl cis-trans isomerase SlyD
MRVTPNAFVRIDCTVHGSVEGSPRFLLCRVSLEYVHECQPMMPGLKEALRGREPGSVVRLTLPPEAAYGNYRLELVRELDISALEGGEEVRVGRRYCLLNAAGEPGTNFTVQRKCGERVLADYNHPWAGQTIHYEVRVDEVRPATFMDFANAAERRWYREEPHNQGLYWR